MKDEAEAYMLKELLSLRWQEKATKLASDDAGKQVAQLQQNVDNMEATRNSERLSFLVHQQVLSNLKHQVFKKFWADLILWLTVLV